MHAGSAAEGAGVLPSVCGLGGEGGLQEVEEWRASQALEGSCPKEEIGGGEAGKGKKKGGRRGRKRQEEVMEDNEKSRR